MARAREFEETEALDRAMRLFWQRGYRGASLPDLLQATQLSRSSLYEAFGTKRELFLAALAQYVGSAMCGLAEPLFRPGAGRPEIEQTFANMIRHAVADQDPRGCLVGNCSTELAPHDEQVLAAVRQARRGLERALVSAIAVGQARGEIGTDEPPLALARFLASALSGLNALARTRPGKKVLQDVVRVSLRALDPGAEKAGAQFARRPG